MNNKPVDRRTTKTKRALSNALAELLSEKELRKITVQEIVDKADVSRVTFYKYYLDVYDLCEKIEEVVLTELGLIVLQLEDNSTEMFFEQLVGYISENRVTFSMIFNPNTTSKLRDKLSKLIEGMLRNVYSEKLGIKPNNKELAYICCYHAQGCLAILQKWVQDGFTEPDDYIIKLMPAIDEQIEDYFSNKNSKAKRSRA
ncbi:MAG: TetR/AcrR family transcriptional regulator [Ruminococcus sp.]|nr:TetR/AcrR family transcriptional regulator [Ruminococcus sp.]